MKYLCMTLLVLLSACGNTVTAEKKENSTNPLFVVDTLFTKDGCTIYRFSDALSLHYFAKCDSDVSVSTESLRHSKSETLPTYRK